MKPILSLILLVLCGCSTQRGERVFIENLSRQLSENNAAFTLDVKEGSILIRRSNPTIGFNGTANSNGVSMLSSSNLAVSVVFHTQTQNPTMPGVQSTNTVPPRK